MHLKAYQDFAQKRVEQIEFVLNILEEHVMSSDIDDIKNQSIILCGDFNGEYVEPFYNLILKHEMIKFSDVYPKSSPNKRHKNVIDYVFYTSKSLNLLSYLELNPLKKNQNYADLPNLEYPSDHFSLVCDFQIV